MHVTSRPRLSTLLSWLSFSWSGCQNGFVEATSPIFAESCLGSGSSFQGAEACVRLGAFRTSRRPPLQRLREKYVEAERRK